MGLVMRLGALVLLLAMLSGQASAQTLTTLLTFSGTNGKNPYAGVTLSLDGSTLYGSTHSGGANGYGAVFSVPVTGGTPTVLASFNDSNGDYPDSGVTLSLDGNTLYGATAYGGAYGYGTVFSLPISGGSPTVLASFNGSNGEIPLAV